MEMRRPETSKKLPVRQHSASTLRVSDTEKHLKKQFDAVPAKASMKKERREKRGCYVSPLTTTCWGLRLTPTPIDVVATQRCCF